MSAFVCFKLVFFTKYFSDIWWGIFNSCYSWRRLCNWVAYSLVWSNLSFSHFLVMKTVHYLKMWVQWFSSFCRGVLYIHLLINVSCNRYQIKLSEKTKHVGSTQVIWKLSKVNRISRNGLKSWLGIVFNICFGYRFTYFPANNYEWAQSLSLEGPQLAWPRPLRPPWAYKSMKCICI